LRYLELTVGLEGLLGRVPDGWEKMCVGVLASLSHSTSPQRTIASDILLKSIATLLVVLHHATPWPIPGGAGTMLVLYGYGLARFQSSALFAGDLRRFLQPFGLVLWPYYLVVLGFSIAWGAIPWASVFLVGNLGFAEPDRHEMLPYLYWFVEAFAQLLLLWGALLCRAFGVPRQGILSVSACCFWRLPSSRISRSRRSRQLGSGKYSPLPGCCTLRLSDGAPPLQIRDDDDLR
jgi:hypothetical protein